MKNVYCGLYPWISHLQTSVQNKLTRKHTFVTYFWICWIHVCNKHDNLTFFIFFEKECTDAEFLTNIDEVEEDQWWNIK